MRRRSLLEQIRLLGASGLTLVEALGRSTIFLMHALGGRSGTRNGFQLLLKQLFAVGVLSLPIIVVSGLFIGMVLAVLSLIMAIKGHQKVEARLQEQERLFEEVTKD